MSKPKNDSTRPRQSAPLCPASLPQPAEGHLAELPLALRAALVETMRPLALSRWQIAGRVSELLGREVSKSMLDAYCADSHDAHRVPADVAVAVTLVAGNPHLLDVMAERARCVMVPLPEVLASDATTDLRAGVLRCAAELGDVATAISEAMRDNTLTRAELLSCQRELRDLIKATCAMAARLEEAL